MSGTREHFSLTKGKECVMEINNETVLNMVEKLIRIILIFMSDDDKRKILELRVSVNSSKKERWAILLVQDAVRENLGVNSSK